jgi:DNA polymerase I-like protein with 3'-5' exonuclease and polymerase domains
MDFDALCNAYLSADVVAFDTEGSSLKAYEAKLFGLSVSCRHNGDVIADYFDFASEPSLWPKVRDALLIPLMQDVSKTIVMHNSTYDYAVLYARGIGVKAKIRDTKLLSFLINNAGDHSLKGLAARLLGFEVVTYKQTQVFLADKLKFAKAATDGLAKDLFAAIKQARAASKSDKDSAAEHYTISTQPIVNKCVELELPSDVLDGVSHTVSDKKMPRVSDVKAWCRDWWFPTLEERAHKEAAAHFSIYAANDAKYTFLLHEYFLERIKERPKYDVIGIHDAIELPSALLAARMHVRGITIDRNQMQAIDLRMRQYAQRVHASIVKNFGEDFNPNSPKFLANYFWVTLKLEPPPWTYKRGKKWNLNAVLDAGESLPSTDKEVMNWLAERGVKAAKAVLLYRQVAKNISTYTQPILNSLDGADRLHPSFNSTGAATSGRWSSSDPNAQNQPRADKMPTMPAPKGWNKGDPIPDGYVYVGE